MKIQFWGAANEVTGSCHLLRVDKYNVLIDCGLQQGAEVKRGQELPFDASSIDCCILTHAHIDHSGRIPLLVKKGFKGKIYSTKATEELCNIMLKDAGHIQEMEILWRNRKLERAGKAPIEPLYTVMDAENAMKYFDSYEYNEEVVINESIKIRFTDAGHLLGSSSVEIWVTENNITKKFVFSGDIGNTDQPIIRDPSYIEQADFVVMESTYGDRLHETPTDRISTLANIIKETFDKGGNLVIPSFAVGRTQELLYFLHEISQKKLVPGYSNIPVYIDSPLAIEAIKIFTDNTFGYYDFDAINQVEKGVNPISFPSLHTAVSTDDSKAINFLTSPVIIISSSGMCEAGRIRHHLKHNLWRPESTILFTGYQAVGTFGRYLLDGAKNVKMFGEEIIVRAKIMKMDGISGHADQNELIKWLESFKPSPQKVFIIHGESEVVSLFTNLLQSKFKSQIIAPSFGQEYDLINETQTSITVNAILDEQMVINKLNKASAKLSSLLKHNLQNIKVSEKASLSELNNLSEKINKILSELSANKK